MAQTQDINSLAEKEDTDETSLAGRLPLVGGLRRLSRSFGKIRPALLVLGWLGLAALGLCLGWPRLEQLCLWLAAGLDLALQKLVGLFRPEDVSGGVLSFAVRYRLAQILSLIWGGCLLLAPVVLCWPRRPDVEELGYVVPGSGWIARSWALIGRQLYRAKKAVIFLFSYLRDLSLEKLYLPPAVLALTALGSVYLAQVIENLLFEVHLALPALVKAGAWMPMTAKITAGACALLFGLPWLAESFRQPHRRAQERRKQGRKFLSRLLAGVFGLFTILTPLLWLFLGLLDGELLGG